MGFRQNRSTEKRVYCAGRRSVTVQKAPWRLISYKGLLNTKRGTAGLMYPWAVWISAATHDIIIANQALGYTRSIVEVPWSRTPEPVADTS